MMADLITGRVDMAWPTLSTSRSYLAEGKLRALALDADARWAPLPDVPTWSNWALPKNGSPVGSRLAGPAGMPPALVAKIRDIFIKASKDPDLQRRLTENGTPIVSSTPEEMGRAMAAEWETMQVLAKTLNLRQPLNSLPHTEIVGAHRGGSFTMANRSPLSTSRAHWPISPSGRSAPRR